MTTENLDPSSPAPEAASPTAAPEPTDFAAFERQVLGRDDLDPDQQPDLAQPGEDDDELIVEEGAEEQHPRKGKTAKERIAEVIGESRAHQRDAEFWRGVAEGRIQHPDAKPAPVQQDPGDNPAPNPSDYEYGEADPKYIAAMARHEARQEFAAQREQERVEAGLAQLEENWASRREAAREKYPDFEEKVIKSAARGEWPCSPVITLGIKDSPVGDDIAHYLATNLDDAVRIHALNPIQQAREFGRLETRFMSPAAPSKKIATDAPEPAPSRARGAGGRFTVDDETTDFAQFEAKYGNRSKR